MPEWSFGSIVRFSVCQLGCSCPEKTLILGPTGGKSCQNLPEPENAIWATAQTSDSCRPVFLERGTTRTCTPPQNFRCTLPSPGLEGIRTYNSHELNGFLWASAANNQNRNTIYVTTDIYWISLLDTKHCAKHSHTYCVTYDLLKS